LCHHVDVTALVRAVRRQRGLTLQALAEQTGLTRSYLSKIERGQSTPSIAAAIKIAAALDADVAQLFSERAAEEHIVVDRAGGGGRYRAVAAQLLGKAMSPFVVRPSGTVGDDPHPTHPGQEFVFVHAGTVELDYGDRTVTLGPGDSAYFDASVTHNIRAVGPAPAEVVVVATNEPATSR
jgi:transcriptional regulator with XRE-family HTH domain